MNRTPRLSHARQTALRRSVGVPPAGSIGVPPMIGGCHRCPCGSTRSRDDRASRRHVHPRNTHQPICHGGRAPAPDCPVGSENEFHFGVSTSARENLVFRLGDMPTKTTKLPSATTPESLFRCLRVARIPLGRSPRLGLRNQVLSLAKEPPKPPKLSAPRLQRPLLPSFPSCLTIGVFSRCQVQGSKRELQFCWIPPSPLSAPPRETFPPALSTKTRQKMSPFPPQRSGDSPHPSGSPARTNLVLLLCSTRRSQVPGCFPGCFVDKYHASGRN